MKIGRVTVSDRAAAGVYTDRSGPVIEEMLRTLLEGDLEFVGELVPDDPCRISDTLRRLADTDACALVVTTGGTGIGPRDVTPEATRAVLDKELPGFGEVMRLKSFEKAPTAPLSRAVAGIRGRTLILNLPGSPKAVRECLEVLAAALREGLRHLGGDLDHPAPSA